MTDDEERDLILQRTPGALESIESDSERQRIAATRDPQLDRAMDLIKGITLFTQRSQSTDHRVAGKK
jgi:hypothetical protein